MTWQFAVTLLTAFCSLALAAGAGCGSGSAAVPWAGGSDRLLAGGEAGPDAKAALPDAWPSLFGPSHTSVSQETGLSLEWGEDGPLEVWRKAVGRGYSTPVTWQDRLVLLHRVGDEDVVSCFNAETGEPRWERRWPTTRAASNDYSDGPYATPVLDGEHVYAVGAEAKFHCLRLASGEIVWSRDLAQDYDLPPGVFSFGASPLLEGDRLIVILGAVPKDAGVIALDKRTGETLWTATDYGPSFCQPKAATIHGRRMVFALTEQGLVALDPADGRQHWFVEFQPKGVDVFNATTPAVWNDLVLLVAGPGPGSLCLRVKPDGSYEEVWKERRAALDSQFNTLIPLEGFVYGFTSKWNRQAQFRCVDLHTGRMQWEFPSEVARGSAVAVGGRVLLWGENGHLAVVDADPTALRVRSLTPQPLLAGPCFSAPVVHRGRLYLRNEKTLLCLSLRS